MSRPILAEDRIHPSIRETVATSRKDMVDEVESAIAAHPIVVVGMSQNPFVRKARGLLKEKGLSFHYLQYGSYVSEWRRRNALKMWSGWPTLPMVFVNGTLIGGYEDTKRLAESGELAKLASAPQST